MIGSKGEGRLYELAFTLIDTAGMHVGGEENSLEARLLEQSLRGLDEADLGLFMIDARQGVTPLDEQLASVLRRTGKPLLLVANKSEGQAAYAGEAEAWGLGLGEPILLSAEHALGLADLADAMRPHLQAMKVSEGAPSEVATDGASPEPATDVPDPEDGPRVMRLAVVGRPNVGKSSLINRLIRSDRLLDRAGTGAHARHGRHRLGV